MEDFGGSAVAASLGQFLSGVKTQQQTPQTPDQGFMDPNAMNNINMTTVYEAWRDPFKGKAYIGKTQMNLGLVEIVQHTFENLGVQYVKFKSGMQISTMELNKQYNYSQEHDDKTQQAVYNAAINNADEANKGKDIDIKIDEFTRASSKMGGQPRVDRKPDIPRNPIVQLLKNMKSDPIECDLKLSLKIPTKELFNVLNQSFDKAIDGVVEFTFSNENFEVLKKSIVNGIKEFYNIPEDIVKDAEINSEVKTDE